MKQDEKLAPFARRIKKPYETVRQWLKENGAIPDHDNAEDIAEVLGTTTLWILDGIGPRDRSEFLEWISKYHKGVRVNERPFEEAISQGG